MVKGPSAKSKAAKAKRTKEKMGVSSAIDADRHADVEKRLIDAHDRAYPKEGTSDTGWVEQSYPSLEPFVESGLMTAEEALEAEEKLYGKRGVDPNFSLGNLVNAHL